MSAEDDICVRLRRGFGGIVPPACDVAANTIDRLRALNAELLAELENIEKAHWEYFTYQEFHDWAKSRARAMLAKAEARK